MKTTTLVLAAALVSPLPSLAQSTAPDDASRIPAAKGTSEDTSGGSAGAGAQYGQGGSPHCDSLQGAERDQCLKDEGAKTDSKDADSKDAAAGATSQDQDRIPAKRDASNEPQPAK